MTRLISDPDWFHPFSCPASPETSLVSLGESFFFFSFAILGLHCTECNGTPLQYSCLEYPMTWKAAVLGVAEDQTRPSDFPFTFHFHALEKEMATHSTVLAWRILGTGELGGLLSMGTHRFGHN